MRIDDVYSRALAEYVVAFMVEPYSPDGSALALPLLTLGRRDRGRLVARAHARSSSRAGVLGLRTRTLAPAR